MAARKAKRSGTLKSKLAKRQKLRQSQKLPKSTIADGSNDSLTIKPRAGLAELAEDAAVFDADYLRNLPTDLQAEAALVYGALELTYIGNFDESMGKLKDISRSSPFSDWRLFIRGLHAFYSGDIDAARQNWSKLDQTRRPARIASTLLIAEYNQPLANETQPCATQVINHAKNLRLRENVVNAAQAIASARHRDSKVTFAVSQAAMLADFINRYQRVDVDFVTTFGQACVLLSTFQGDFPVFDRLTKLVRGPAADPNWNNLRFHYLLNFEGEEKTAFRVAEAFLRKDLPQLAGITEQVHNAIACKLYLLLAEIAPSKGGRVRLGSSTMYFDKDYGEINALLRKAIEYYPEYRPAHQQLIQSLEIELDERTTDKAHTAKLEKQIVEAKEALVKALPQDADTVIWLIDHYLEEDQLDKALALVKNLEGQRIQDPSVKALHWKLKLREAMHLSNRKADLSFAVKALEEADSLWPSWLSRNWLPFLHAAISLRRGDKEKFEQLASQARQDQKCSETVGDFMMFAALQQVNLPSAELKPFRTRIDQYLKTPDSIELEDLFGLGSYFWDLARAGIKHKAYRVQASKLGKAFKAKTQSYRDTTLTPTQIDAFCWGAHHRFWPANYADEPPDYLIRLSSNQPRLAAALAQWIMNGKYSGWRIREYKPMITSIKDAARVENDPFYRFLFDKTTRQAEEIIADDAARRRQITEFGTDYSDSMDDEEDSFDNDCDCASCRARRAKSTDTAKKRNSEVNLFDDDEDYEDDDYDYDDDEDDDYDDFEEDSFSNAEIEELSSNLGMPPIVTRILTRLGPQGVIDLNMIFEAENRKSDLAQFSKRLQQLFEDHGISPAEEEEFIAALNETLDPTRGVKSQSSRRQVPGSESSDEMTPEGKIKSRKQRAKILDRKKRKV
jgi:hypothetical protein